MRLKIIAGNVIAILIVGLVSYFVVTSEIEHSVSTSIGSEIENDQRLFDRSWRLSALEFVDHVRSRARTEEVRATFTALDEQNRRRSAHTAANDVSQWFRDPARGRAGAPDIVCITDNVGKVIARDTDPNRMYGNSLLDPLPTMRKVLETGEAQHDVWARKDEEKLLQTGIAPIRNADGTVVGTLVVGYDLSNALAESEAGILGREVAFIAEGDVYSASLSSDVMGHLKKHLFGPWKNKTHAALRGDASPTAWSAQLGADQYVGVTAPLAASSSAKVAYAVLANKSAALELASTTYVILLLTVLGVIGVAVYGFVIGTSFLRPLEQIEEGVLQVINGRTDHRIDVNTPELGGLAYRINQLINVFTGVSEEDEEGRMAQGGAQSGGGGGAWQGAAFGGETTGNKQAAPGGGGGDGGTDVIDDPEVAKQLEAESEEQYHARIYQEYVGAKKAVGEDVSNIPQDRFVQRLDGNAQALARRHNVRAVRFQVQQRGNQVVLKPVLIR